MGNARHRGASAVQSGSDTQHHTAPSPHHQRLSVQPAPVIRVELTERRPERGGVEHVARVEAFNLEVTTRAGCLLCKLARVLIDRGISPITLLEPFRNGTLCFRPVRISTWANLDVTEDSRGPRFVRHQSGPEPSPVDKSYG